MTNNKVHVCTEDRGSFTIENRGDGWYLYSGNERGPKPINFCPCCGKSTEEFDEEARRD